MTAGRARAELGKYLMPKRVKKRHDAGETSMHIPSKPETSMAEKAVTAGRSQANMQKTKIAVKP